MKLLYYPGHSWKWIDEFLVPIKKSKLRESTAILLLSAIQQQYSCTKKLQITLTHSLLQRFGLCSKRMRPYLECWVKSKKIEVVFKNRAAPLIILHSSPSSYRNTINKRKERKE